ncbi:hypothetical protein LINPERPRIM_LOCUS43185 [Linum perenne]
MLLSGS